MHTIYYVGGEKGGTGKSFLTKSILQYLYDYGLDFVAIDTDRSNPDVKRCYDKVCSVKLAVLSEAERLQDSGNIIFNAALEHDVVCNLPAQVAPALHQWLTDNNLIELAAEMDIKMRLFFVSDAGYESLKLFERSLTRFGADIPHTLVRNFGMTDDWSPVTDDHELQALIERYKVKVIDLPRFIGNADRNFIDRHSISFGEALTHPALGAISRHRVKTFLKKTYQAFESAQLFPQSTVTAQKVQQGGQHHG